MIEIYQGPEDNKRPRLGPMARINTREIKPIAIAMRCISSFMLD